MGYIVGDIKREQTMWEGLIVMTAPHCCCIVTIVTAWWVNHHGKLWFWYGNLSVVHIFAVIIVADIILNATTARMGFLTCFFSPRMFMMCASVSSSNEENIYSHYNSLYVLYIDIANSVLKIYLRGYIFSKFLLLMYYYFSNFSV